MRLEGATALVTGAASGLGEATAKRLVNKGANVVLADLNEQQGNDVAKTLGKRAAFLAVDVRNPEQVQAAIDLAVARFGRLDLAANCAGIIIPSRTVTKAGPHDLAVFRMVVDVNLVGTFNVIRLAALSMQRNEPNEDGERGVIVNTASIAAFDGPLGGAAYAASKGGVVAMTLPIARDLGSLGIRICSIAPGSFETPMVAGLSASYASSMSQQTPFPSRLGRPDEYALLVQQIIENPMLNGETIRLDGAQRMPPK